MELPGAEEHLMNIICFLKASNMYNMIRFKHTENIDYNSVWTFLVLPQ